ncbi:MAG: hypothetical protein KDD58_04085 [Bdellovibrionales bacterium]|nr:hypothetical protein [Bdellovibrionales bacterium]
MSIKKLINSLKILTQHCWICSFPTFCNYELCHFCQKHVYARPFFFNDEIDLKGYCLWEWSKTKNHWCKDVIYKLKRKKILEIHEFLAQLFLKQEILYLRSQRNNLSVILIPSPCTPNTKTDHARSMAMAISEMTGWPILDVLQKGSQINQKAKSRKERLNIKVNLSHQFKMDPQKTYIFIDDVITTGSTARACWETLGRPPKFEVRALIYRSSSCL